MSGAVLSPATRAALADGIARLRQALPPHSVPLRRAGVCLGHVPAPLARELPALAAGLIVAGEGGLDLTPTPAGVALDTALATLADTLRRAGWAPAWRDEPYDLRPVLDGSGDGGVVLDWAPGVARLERGVFRPLGLQSRAVHLNGLAADGRMWIGRRAATKAVDPSRLDNLVGGGIGAGETPADCLLRECAEEAGLPAALARAARPVACLHARRPEFDGLHDEWLFIYDLVLPADFVPCNQDGEVAGFECLPFSQVAERVLDGEFTEDAGAVAADCLLRLA